MPDQRSRAGHRAAVDAIRARFPPVRSYTRRAVQACSAQYLAVGWTGYVPRACRHGVMMLPVNHAGLAWGFPRRLQARMDRADTLVVLIGPWHPGEGHARAVDDVALLDDIPGDDAGGVWTNRADRVGPALNR